MRKTKKLENNPKIRRGIFILPSLLTIGNIFFGFYAIIHSINGKYLQASLLIFFSFLLDGLDGTIARLTKTESLFGLNLDSLADVISFGVAPAILAYTISLRQFGGFGWGVTLFYVICGAIRLARFNSHNKTEIDRKYFIGLPIPMSAAFIASFIIFFDGNIDYYILPTIALVSIFIIGCLMISTLKYRSFKEIDFKKKRPTKMLFAIAIGIIVIAAIPEKIPCLFCFCYIISPFIIPPFKKVRESFQESYKKFSEKIDHHIDQ
jgi:CDP-diacylglycerol---serine O-phosphatidyltransferase